MAWQDVRYSAAVGVQWLGNRYLKMVNLYSLKAKVDFYPLSMKTPAIVVGTTLAPATISLKAAGAIYLG